MLNKLLYLFSSFLALVFSVTQTYAEELVISGNGEGSQNQINLSTTSVTSVEQTNNASIENNVENSADTGENSASDNTGSDIAITTGDITSETSIENSGNVSVVEGGCCPTAGDTTLTIDGNGAYSENLIDTTSENNTIIVITQTANITNTVTTNANTGKNSANDNTGSSGGNGDYHGTISIDTGDITISQELENTIINLAHVAAFDPGTSGDVTIRIVNNGTYSENKIFPKWFSDVFISVNNTTNIENSLTAIANTGGNSANGNNGDVSITTGDINIGINVKNGPINTSIVDVSCCSGKGGHSPSDPGDPGNPTPPPTPASAPPIGGSVNGSNGHGNGNGNNGSNSNGETLAAVIGGILPATGFNWFLATIANVLMFLFGLYLRRRSGRSPGDSYAWA